MSSRYLNPAWTGLVEQDPERDASTRVPQLALAALLPFVGLGVHNLPVEELTAIGLILIASVTRAPRRVGLVMQLVVPMTMVPVWLAISSQLNGIHEDVRRLGHLAIWVLLAYAIASGRLHRPSLAKGMAFGLIGAVALSLVHSGGYSGRLSGAVGDPNSAGLVAATFGCIVLGTLWSARRGVRALLVIGLIAVVLGTLSRTSIAALIVALTWVFVGRRQRLGLRAAVGIGVIYALTKVPESILQSGIFAGREGSDALRQRIEAQETLAVAAHPMYGNGAGTATVNVQGQPFYFHSSYLGLRAEGGWIALGFYGLVVAVVFLMLVRLPFGQHNAWFEASIIVVLICAAYLGEVLLTETAAVAVGFAAAYAFDVRERADAPDPPLPAASRRGSTSSMA